MRRNVWVVERWILKGRKWMPYSTSVNLRMARSGMKFSREYHPKDKFRITKYEAVR